MLSEHFSENVIPLSNESLKNGLGAVASHAFHTLAFTDVLQS